MTLISEDERMELLEMIDNFTMAKIMYENNLEIEPFDYQSEWNGKTFMICMSKLSERYPIFTIRSSKHEKHTFAIGITLPSNLKHSYKKIKSDMKRLLEDNDYFFGEIIISEHYNELHAEVYNGVQYHDILMEFLIYLRSIKEEMK